MQNVQIVNISERGRLAIELGESHFREFKSALHGVANEKVAREAKAICRDIGEALVAFANADGGELLIGVEDDGNVTGIDLLREADIEALKNAPKAYVHNKTPLPPIRTATLDIEGKCVLYFSISKSTTFVHLTSDGRCVQRRDLETVPIPAEEIQFGRRERASREYDREYLDGATTNDLTSQLVEAVARQKWRPPSSAGEASTV